MKAANSRFIVECNGIILKAAAKAGIDIELSAVEKGCDAVGVTKDSCLTLR